MRKNQPQGSRTSIIRGLIVAGVLIGGAVVLERLSPAYLGADAARRMLGVLMGAVVVLYANAVPKALLPLAQMRCAPAEEQAMRRFTGWSLAVGGAGYALAWVVAPLAHARLLGASFLGGAVLLVLLRLSRAIPGRSHR